jgi:hypothetical protein
MQNSDVNRASFRDERRKKKRQDACHYTVLPVTSRGWIHRFLISWLTSAILISLQLLSAKTILRNNSALFVCFFVVYLSTHFN